MQAEGLSRGVEEGPINNIQQNTIINQAAFVTGVIVTYCGLALAMYWVIHTVATKYGLSATLAPAFAQVVAAIGIAVVVSAWTASAAAPQDRRLYLMKMGCVFGPSVAMIFPLWLLRFGVWALTEFEFWMMFLPIPFISFFWLQVSGPVLRKWVNQNAHDPALIAQAESRFRLSSMMSESELRETEFAIPRESYLGLLTGAATALFLILETAIGEFLDNLIGKPGYVNALIIALLVATIVYPLNRWASLRFNFHYSLEEKSINGNDFSFLAEVASKSRKFYFHMFIRRWYLWPFVVILGIFFAKKVLLGPLSLY